MAIELKFRIDMSLAESARDLIEADPIARACFEQLLEEHGIDYFFEATLVQRPGQMMEVVLFPTMTLSSIVASCGVQL
jgi:hypothetical protein